MLVFPDRRRAQYEQSQTAVTIFRYTATYLGIVAEVSILSLHNFPRIYDVAPQFRADRRLAPDYPSSSKWRRPIRGLPTKYRMTTAMWFRL